MDGSLPGLMEFYGKEKSDRFEILAFHDASVSTLAELEEKLIDIKEKHWKGRDLPFPVLLDATGTTIKEFDIHAFPTTILVDPHGRLVGEGDLEALKKALADERTKS